MKNKITLLTLTFSISILSLNYVLGQTLLHQITRGDITFQLYDDGFKINSVSKGIVLLESCKLGTDLPIGIASYPFSNVNYVNNLHLVVQDNFLFNQWYANTISSWTANNSLYQVDAIFQNTFYNEGFSFHMEILANDKIRIDIQKTNNLAQPWTFRTKLCLKLFPNEYFMRFGERLEGVAFRGKKMLQPRDNVLFELGLFTGRLGTSKCAFLIDKEIKLVSVVMSTLKKAKMFGAKK